MVLLGVVTSYGVDLVPDGLRQRLHFRWNDPEAMSEIEAWHFVQGTDATWIKWGKALDEAITPGDSLVVYGLGAIGWFAPGLDIHDGHGLVSRIPKDAWQTGERRTPGHDCKLEREWFFAERPVDERPTIYSVIFLPPDAAIPDRFQRKFFRVERHPLPPELGFGEDEICLVRPAR